MQQLSAGATLQGGKYIIEKILGQGGFGITYLATDSRTGKYVAVKEFFPKDYCIRDDNTGYVTLLRPEMEKYKRKFISEANKIAQLNHKGIIKVIGVFEENGTAYYAMEYIAGQSLFELLKQRKFTLEESLKIIEKVSKALSHIHSKRMLHLDIKPMNIMMRSSDNEPIIIDFGISKTYDAQGNPNTTFIWAATPGYSPSEQFEGEINSFAPQLDIYSLGATLYNLITGIVPPYPTPSTAQKLVFEVNIPSYVVDAVKTAMAYKPENRYKSVDAFIVALKGSRAQYTDNNQTQRQNDNYRQRGNEDAIKKRAEKLSNSLRPNMLLPAMLLTILFMLFCDISKYDDSMPIVLYYLFVFVAMSGFLWFFLYLIIGTTIHNKRIANWKSEHSNDPKCKYL